MDLNFARYGLRPRQAASARLDHGSLVAMLAALQANSRTAYVQASMSEDAALDAAPHDALATLFTGAPGWQAAAAMLGGSFHPATARRGANLPSMKMTGAFTLPG